MATQNNLHVPDELLAELQSKAEAEGKTVDKLAEETLRKGLEDRAWQELLAYGQERGLASGYTEEDVPRVVRENRQRHRSSVFGQLVAPVDAVRLRDISRHRLLGAHA
jgi:hypothetical protein